MKNLRRIIALLCMLVLCFSMVPSASAATAKGKGMESVTFTVTTGKKDAKLTVKQSAGKVTGTAWKNIFKHTTKTVTKKAYGVYAISAWAPGKRTITKRISSSKQTLTLERNSTYTVTISYEDFDVFSLWGPVAVWNASWKTKPSWKASVNNWAKLRNGY